MLIIKSVESNSDLISSLENDGPKYGVKSENFLGIFLLNVLCKERHQETTPHQSLPLGKNNFKYFTFHNKII